MIGSRMIGATVGSTFRLSRLPPFVDFGVSLLFGATAAWIAAAWVVRRGVAPTDVMLLACNTLYLAGMCWMILPPKDGGSDPYPPNAPKASSEQGTPA